MHTWNLGVVEGRIEVVPASFLAEGKRVLTFKAFVLLSLMSVNKNEGDAYLALKQSQAQRLFHQNFGIFSVCSCLHCNR